MFMALRVVALKSTQDFSLRVLVFEFVRTTCAVVDCCIPEEGGCKCRVRGRVAWRAAGSVPRRLRAAAVGRQPPSR